MENLLQLLDSAQLVKAVIEQKTGFSHSSSLTFIDDLTMLSVDQNEVFYFGILTIGNETYGQKINIMPQKFFTDDNYSEKVLFNSIAGDDSGDFNYPITPINGNFYGYVFTPTNNASKSISLD